MNLHLVLVSHTFYSKFLVLTFNVLIYIYLYNITVAIMSSYMKCHWCYKFTFEILFALYTEIHKKKNYFLIIQIIPKRVKAYMVNSSTYICSLSFHLALRDFYFNILTFSRNIVVCRRPPDLTTIQGNYGYLFGAHSSREGNTRLHNVLYIYKA